MLLTFLTPLHTLRQNYKLATFFATFLLCDKTICDNFCDFFACFATFLVEMGKLRRIFLHFRRKIFVASFYFGLVTSLCLQAGEHQNILVCARSLFHPK